MKSLPKPPSVHVTAGAQLLLVGMMALDDEVLQYLSAANSDYWHWEQAKYKAAPKGANAKDAWVAIKHSRRPTHFLPLRSLSRELHTYWVPPQASRVLSSIDRQVGLPPTSPLSPTAQSRHILDRLRIDGLMDEAIATSQIEGAVTTTAAAKELLRSGRRPKDLSERMVVNSYHTMQMIKTRLEEPLTIDLIHDIQRSITHGTLQSESQAGRFRLPSEKVHIVDVRDNEVIFTPPPAGELPALMAAMIEFANDPSADPAFVHPVIRAICLHFWLAYAHPYCDGNGRTARALMYWYMLKQRYSLFEYLSLSRAIHNKPRDYYRAFRYVESDAHDLTYFLMNQLKVIEQAIDLLNASLADLTASQSRTATLPGTRKLNSRQRALIDHALRHPESLYTFEAHQASHGVAYETARNDILGLVRHRLLIEVGSHRPREFMPPANLADRLTKKA